jgi:peptide/nickel transport system permease protein
VSERNKEEIRKVLYQIRHSPLVIIGLVVVVFWLLLAIFAVQIAPVEPLQQNIMGRLTAPGDAYFLGSDELGRDIFSRVIYGARITIPAGIIVIIISSVLGASIGAVAGFIGGVWDELLMRITELFMAFPTIILAMAVAAALGPSIKNQIIALVIVWWPSYARMMRGLVLSVKTSQYVESSRSVGAPEYYVLFRTIVPNCISPLIVMTTLDVGNAILTFAGLSFLGLGAEPASPDWGRMVAVGINYFDQWWMWLYPGIAIASLVMALNFIGDGIRDIADPRTR